MLGGNVDFLTDKRLRDNGLDPVETPTSMSRPGTKNCPRSRRRPATRPPR
ncbi:translocase subunit secA 1 domain protein [Mycobacterium ulcerans str. Harvey]|uniref:Translocase subunit secA 1 domain protein n=1 Tax=Mycobacterium ulcerans str. Harvey TaxID=1299332 RepID=A0ABN0R8N9_MYCUL|nr:translocase subunit secA 1 domain protein [Mycobacterium ulcerans str. Harvey]